MRGVAGIAFVFLGLVMGYMVLSGKFPSSGNLVQGPAVNAASGTVTADPNNISKWRANPNAAGGPLGLPTMGNLNDLVPSNGGYYPSNQH